MANEYAGISVHNYYERFSLYSPNDLLPIIRFERVKFAIVDIETTGLYHQGHGITEIAIIHLDDGLEPTLAFHSLVNPNRSISGYISELTGIESKTVADAPSIESLIPEIMDALEGRVFVAHNVNFDYHFLKAAFESVGQSFHYPRFCTMRYARRVIPSLKSHRLGIVLKHLGITNDDAHRAAGDAWATAELFKVLRKKDKKGHFDALIKQNSHHAVLPPNVKLEDIQGLPESHGVYHFYNQNKKRIYIGKAKNLKRRVLSHFTSAGSSSRKMLFQREVYSIEYVKTSSEYESLIIEDAAIKKYWPRYNRAQKERVSKFGIVPYKNRKDELRLAILKTNQRTDFPHFNSYASAKVWLYRSLVDAGISPQVAGFAEPEDFTPTHNQNLDERILAFMASEHEKLKGSFLLFNSKAEKPTAIAIVEGKYVGYGPLSDKVDTMDEWVDKHLNRAQESAVALNVVKQMLNDDKIQKIEFA